MSTLISRELLSCCGEHGENIEVLRICVASEL